jgi:hypothetical protein
MLSCREQTIENDIVQERNHVKGNEIYTYTPLRRGIRLSKWSKRILGTFRSVFTWKKIYCAYKHE